MFTLTSTMQQVSALFVATRVVVIDRATTQIGARLHLDDERGEGVISAAIAVLVMAFLGALMWVAFKTIFDNASSKTSDQVNQIGQ